MTALTLPLSPRGRGRGEGVWDLGDWDLFETWCLLVGRGFGAFPQYAVRHGLSYWGAKK